METRGENSRVAGKEVGQIEEKFRGFSLVEANSFGQKCVPRCRKAWPTVREYISGPAQNRK